MTNKDILPRLENVLNCLNIDYTDTGSRIYFPCPIHGSDNRDSLSILKETGKWKCWTNGCEQGNFSLFEMIHAIRCSNGEKTPEDTYKFILELNAEEDYSFTPQSKIEYSIPRQEALNNLVIPADYYIQRGYSTKILEKYDIGFCGLRTKKMFMRVVVPVYDISHKMIIGCCGRSVNPKCEKCNGYHQGYCPTNGLEDFWANKWINSKGFSRAKYLYNLWFAKEHIIKTGTITIVEGPGDVWRLEEAGIHNSVALFGSDMTQHQKNILRDFPIYKIIIATDNDEAGNKARDKIKSKLGNFYIYQDIIPPDDIGEMQLDDIKVLFT